MYECQICKEFARRTLKEVIRHIRDVHGHHFTTPVRCGINDCSTTASTYESLRQHLYKKHRSILIPSESSNPSRDVMASAPVPFIGDAVTVDDTTRETAATSKHTDLEASTNVLEMGRFILKIRDGKGLTQVVTDSIVKDLQSVVECSCESMEEQLISKLTSFNKLSVGELEEVKEIFLSVKESFNCEELKTQYKQDIFFQENFSYVPPTERVLGADFCLAPSGAMREVKDCFYYVPLLSSLQAMLNFKEIRDQVFHSHQLDSGKLGDYCDGEIFKSHGLFDNDPHAFQIVLYYDDLEVCNVVGSKAKIHKLSLFYFTLGNIHPKYRSSLHAIQLLCAVETHILEKYSINQVLEPFMQDIKQLETNTGAPFTIDNQTVYLRGTLTLVSADNIASNLIAGYKSLTSAFRKCRTCMATTTDMQTKFHDDDFQLRSRLTHAYHCSDLDGPLHDHFATTYGISCDSILNTSSFFHIVDGMIPDIMHDILEGSLHLNIRCLLQHCIQREHYFSVRTLNARLTSFYFGTADSKNRPSTIGNDFLTSRNALRQSSSQAWCLGRFLPLLIGDLILEDDEEWSGYLMFLKIMEYAFAPVITPDKLNYLQMLIQDYLFEFTRLYPDQRLSPKAHYLTHICTWTKRCGPLVRSWCMRFEAKHKYFKKMAQTLNNFINIAKTLAHRHQRFMCYKMTCSVQYLHLPNSYGSAKRHIVSELEYASNLLQSTELTANSSVLRVSFADISGTRYSKGDLVICAMCDDDPLFGKLVDIVINERNEKYWLILQPFIATGFSKHFNAYEVEPQRDYIICQQQDLVDHHTLSICKSFDLTLQSTNYVVLKYFVM